MKAVGIRATDRPLKGVGNRVGGFTNETLVHIRIERQFFKRDDFRGAAGIRLRPVNAPRSAPAYHQFSGVVRRGPYMALKEEQIATLRSRMLARSRLLEGEIAAKLRESTEDAEMLGRVGDSADLAWVESESGLDLTEAQRDIEEWRGLRDALRRIAQGGYGVCSDCGADIPARRLESQPLALRCVDCQSDSEYLGRLGRRAG